MGKNIKWSIEDMKKKNLVSDAKGDFVKVSSLVQKGRVPKIDPNYAFLKPVHVPDLPNIKYPMTPDESFKDLATFGTAITHTETDLFGNITTTVISPPDTALDPLSGEYILWVRTLTGKARDNAVRLLNDLTVSMMQEADKDCFYIPNDVRSSKNSKEIGKFKKRNSAGVLEDFTTLVESKAAKEYRKVTANYWLQNKVEFLNQSRGLKLPLRIEFTFIRETLRRYDFVNAAQILLDLMVEFGYMPDDETCYVVPVFNPVYYSKQLAGVLIRIIK